MKKIHLNVMFAVAGLFAIAPLTSCSSTGRDFSNAARVDQERPVRTFHPSRRTQGSSARLHLEKPEFDGEKKAPSRGFHPSRRP